MGFLPLSLSQVNDRCLKDRAPKVQQGSSSLWSLLRNTII